LYYTVLDCVLHPYHTRTVARCNNIMNNKGINGDNPRRQQQHPPPGHLSLPPQYQQHFQQQHSQLHAQNQDPQLAYLLANAAAARNQQQQHSLNATQSMGIGNNGNSGGFGGPGAFGNGNERGGNVAQTQSTAASLFEEQILQRAAALRAEALMQQQQQQQQNQQHSQQRHQHNPYAGSQQQHQQQKLQIQAALQAFQQQRPLAGGPPQSSAPNNSASSAMKNQQSDIALQQQHQEATGMARAAVLRARELGIAGSPGGAPVGAGPASAMFGSAPGAGPPSGPGGGAGNPNVDRLREQLDISALMRHRQQQQSQTNHQRAYGLDQELERVRHAQRLATMNVSPRGDPVRSNVSVDKNNSDPSSTKNIVDKTAVAAQKSNVIALPKNDSESGSAKGASMPASSSSSVSSTVRPGQPDTAVPNNDGISSRPPDVSSNALAQPMSAKSSQRSSMASSSSEQSSKAGGEPIAAGAAAAAAVMKAASNKTEEELRKNPGTVIVPCRARGMPMDHNFISAYFVISEDAMHGENLVCSYFACRNGGIKFRYCAYCMAPVAKRNFSRRHDHGMSKNKGGSSIRDEEEEDDDDTVGESEKLQCIPCDEASTSTFGNNALPSPKEDKMILAVEENNKRKRAESDDVKAQVVISVVSSERRTLWNNLLKKRPRTKDPTELSAWLNEVLAISDVDFPLDQVAAENMNQPLGKILLNQLPTLSKATACPTEGEAGDSNDAMDSYNNGSATTADDSTTNKKTAETVVGNAKTEKKRKENTQKSVAVSGTKLLRKNAKTSLKKSAVGVAKIVKDEEEGFAGSFADWRDRKKGKSSKKGSGSLRK